MWLLHTVSLTLRFFPYSKKPEYAILSHRWEKKGEFTFRRMSEFVEIEDEDSSEGNIDDSPRNARLEKELKKCVGGQKILDLCEKAYEHQPSYKWVWIDTCCIDKSSSAELSESINSMYSWYEKAGICFVYMSDVLEKRDFEQSQWFKRGWTLQELLAPKKLIFLNSKWRDIGDNNELAHEICRATENKIPLDAVRGTAKERQSYIKDVGIAQKMSWAFGRDTTRKEDMAYSLLGLFNIKMPLIYGEGFENAFERLQTAMLCAGIDETIFVWNNKKRPEAGNKSFSNHLGLLATKLDRFENNGPSEIVPYEVIRNIRPPWRDTHQGVCISLKLYPYTALELDKPDDWIPRGWENKIYVTPLRCHRKGTTKSIVICLYRIPGSTNWYRRVGDWMEADVEKLEKCNPPVLDSDVVIVLRSIIGTFEGETYIPIY